MANFIKVKYQLNEGIFVLHGALTPLYEKYQYILPQNIREQFEQMLIDMANLIGDDGTVFERYDIVDEDLFLEVELEKYDEKSIEEEVESK